MSNTSQTATATADPTPMQAGRMLGGYRLLRSLGKGGLGEVFEAQAADGRSFAIKTFDVRDDGQGLVASAFFREARLGQQLDHPDIVKVLTSGCDGDDAYLVMDFVPGHDLRRHTAPNRLLRLRQVLCVVDRVASALAAAHAVGVIHRDVKPGNVLVDWASDTVKVTDFGLARFGDAFRSRTGIIAGTPGYMSPEQLAESTVGPSSDLYSLGVLLFELLTGCQPHRANTLGALLLQVANQPAPSLLTLRADLPPALEELVAELLSKHPERRPASAATVADRLKQLLAALPAADPAEPPGPKSRA